MRNVMAFGMAVFILGVVAGLLAPGPTRTNPSQQALELVAPAASEQPLTLYCLPVVPNYTQPGSNTSRGI